MIAILSSVCQLLFYLRVCMYVHSAVHTAQPIALVCAPSNKAIQVHFFTVNTSAQSNCTLTQQCKQCQDTALLPQYYVVESDVHIYTLKSVVLQLP
jgi:hypothetical protein